MAYEWNRTPLKGEFPELFAINRSVVRKAFLSQYRGVKQTQFLIVWVQKGGRTSWWGTSGTVCGAVR